MSALVNQQLLRSSTKATIHSTTSRSLNETTAIAVITPHWKANPNRVIAIVLRELAAPLTFFPSSGRREGRVGLAGRQSAFELAFEFFLWGLSYAGHSEVNRLVLSAIVGIRARESHFQHRGWLKGNVRCEMGPFSFSFWSCRFFTFSRACSFFAFKIRSFSFSITRNRSFFAKPSVRLLIIEPPLWRRRKRLSISFSRKKVSVAGHNMLAKDSKTLRLH